MKDNTPTISQAPVEINFSLSTHFVERLKSLDVDIEKFSLAVKAAHGRYLAMSKPSETIGKFTLKGAISAKGKDSRQIKFTETSKAVYESAKGSVPVILEILAFDTRETRGMKQFPGSLYPEFQEGWNTYLKGTFAKKVAEDQKTA